MIMNYAKIKKPDLLKMIKERDAEIAILKQNQSSIDRVSISILNLLDTSIDSFYKKFVIGKVDDNKPIYKEVKDSLVLLKKCILANLRLSSPSLKD